MKMYSILSGYVCIVCPHSSYIMNNVCTGEPVRDVTAGCTVLRRSALALPARRYAPGFTGKLLPLSVYTYEK